MVCVNCYFPSMAAELVEITEPEVLADQYSVIRMRPVSDVFSAFAKVADRMHAHVRIDAQDESADTYPFDSDFTMHDIGDLPAYAAVSISVQLRGAMPTATTSEVVPANSLLVSTRLIYCINTFTKWKLYNDRTYKWSASQPATPVHLQTLEDVTCVIGLLKSKFS